MPVLLTDGTTLSYSMKGKNGAVLDILAQQDKKAGIFYASMTIYKKKEDYGRMMKQLTSYTVAGKNRHDDVPDGMAMLLEYARFFHRNKV